MTLAILKWKLVSEILSVTTGLQVFPSLSNSAMENFFPKDRPVPWKAVPGSTMHFPPKNTCPPPVFHPKMIFPIQN